MAYTSLAVLLCGTSSSMVRSSGACHRADPPFEDAEEWDVQFRISGSFIDDSPKSARQARPASVTRIFD